jgi:CubicO group peptidase (beta-lactamase class C family)
MSTPRLDRRHFLAALGAGLAIPRRAFAEATSHGIDARLAQAEQAGRVSGLHALLVSQRGKLVFEHYGQGEDIAWGRPLGTVAFAPDVLHDLRSVSKSLVGLIYGVALAAGKVPPPEARLYDQFPEYPDLAKQPGRDRLTIHHALSMTLGFDWDELTIPYGDPRNAENAMELAPDRYCYILERPIVGEPGVKWTYCGGATALLGRLIAKGTGQTLLDYSRRVLFEPLGFGPSEWTTGNDGEPHAASGLRLRPRDMLKVGELVLAGGAWNGRQVVPADWIKRATTSMVGNVFGGSYGYQWYLDALVRGTRTLNLVGGIGWGGQRLAVFPGLDLAMAINCGNYRMRGAEQSRIARTVIGGIVLPGFL